MTGRRCTCSGNPRADLCANCAGFGTVVCRGCGRPCPDTAWHCDRCSELVETAPSASATSAMEMCPAEAYVK